MSDQQLWDWGEERRTRQVSESSNAKTPPRMLRERVQHVIQEPDAGPDPDLLRVGSLAGMVFGGLLREMRRDVEAFRQEVQRTAVERQ